MFRKFALAFAALFLLPVLVLAQDGKLRGKITDKESGEPLIGANVVVEGTSLGAATDVNGEYVILSVPPGTYSAKASYIGYSPVTIANVRVNSNLTTTQDFQLSSTSVQVKAVEIVAERPLIQRNTTNTVRLEGQESIKNIAFRGNVQNIVALEAGVVQQGGNLYVRGGRAGEVAYYIDGANTTNPMFNTQNVGVIQDAIEELQLQSGGFTAEYGGANAGIVRTQVRTGGSEWKASLNYLTDDFAKPGQSFLGTSAYGYRNAILTLGGPITSNVKLFVAGQHNYMRDRRPMYLQPFEFDSLVTDALGVRPAGVPLPGNIVFQKNYLYNNWDQTNSVQGTLLFDFSQFKLRFTGSYEARKQMLGGDWTGFGGALGGYFNQGKNPLQDINTGFGSVRLTHVISPTTFYEIGVSYQSRYNRVYDQDFGDDWRSYADSIPNANLNNPNYQPFLFRYQGPLAYSVIQQFGFAAPGSPNNGYAKNKQTSVGATIDFTSQVNSRWELKVGGKIETWNIRNFSIADISRYLVQQYGIEGNVTPSWPDDYTRRVTLIRGGGVTNRNINNFGYDVDGNESDGFSYNGVTLDAPYKPLFASAYIQNKFEYSDLILNFGLRFEYMDIKGQSLPQANWDNPPTDTTHSALTAVDETAFQKTDPISFLMPRISFSFPVTDKTVFYALYGNYAQYASLDNLYQNSIWVGDRVGPKRNAYYLGGGGLPGFLMKPERNTQYEVGFRQTLSDNFAFTFSGFYKDLRNQLSIRRANNANGNAIFVALQNEDFGTIKGLEMTMELRRTARLAAKMSYTLSDGRGTGSTPLSSSNGVTDDANARIPLFINPLVYNQTHRGTIMLDYRFDKGDGGPVLEGVGINLLMTFNSGHPFTLIKEPQSLGQASAWNVGIRALLDSRSRNPVEAINSSSTPWVFNVDLNVNKMFYLGAFNFELYVNVLNLLNTMQVINVYPTSGTPFDDGWLKSPFATSFKAIPNYTAFYQAINLNNRAGYISATGNDVYGTPRQIRIGARLEF